MEKKSVWSRVLIQKYSSTMIHFLQSNHAKESNRAECAPISVRQGELLGSKSDMEIDRIWQMIVRYGMEPEISKDGDEGAIDSAVLRQEAQFLLEIILGISRGECCRWGWCARCRLYGEIEGKSSLCKCSKSSRPDFSRKLGYSSWSRRKRLSFCFMSVGSV